MKIIKMKSRITSNEKETCLNYDYIEKKWIMCSFISTHYNKALRKGWTPIVKYEYDDNTIAGYELEAPSYAITIRSVEKKKMSEKQLKNLNDDK